MELFLVAAPADGEPPPDRPKVTQAMLADYLAVEELWRVREERRKRLLALLEAGAAVEPGPLAARIDYQGRSIFSWTKLLRVLGQAGVERLADEVGPTVCRFLRVTSRPM